MWRYVLLAGGRGLLLHGIGQDVALCITLASVDVFFNWEGIKSELTR